MAEVEVFHASVQVGDGAKLLASGSMRVSPANARLYLAAANAAARAATDVGILLARMLATTRAAGTQTWKKWSILSDFVNDAFVYPATDSGIYNSNKWKVTVQTTNNGLPAIDTFYVPEYLITGVAMASNGIDADLGDQPIADFAAAVVSTGISKYGTAITAVLSISRNDS